MSDHELLYGELTITCGIYLNIYIYTCIHIYMYIYTNMGVSLNGARQKS